jgi:EAL domain-containing protein (putative c-di-GMP-specific phosphodiesterase class I)
VGLGLDLERATLETALDAAVALSPSRFLHVNVSPALVLDGTDLKRLLGKTRARIVLEVTEHTAVEDYLQFRYAIDNIGVPVLLAVDDAGAGFASLRHILELRPSFIKLDQSLVRGIDEDPAKQALVAGMRHFARMTCRRLIAEGVETQAEAAALRELDVRLGQGYLFGRPAQIVAQS